MVVVVGGGAAGFFGAIACAEAYPHTQVTLLEASSHLLAKVRISGGGRCNVTHACFDPGVLVKAYPRGAKALRGPLACFQPQDTIQWFATHGVQLKTEADGRMFPVSDNSETIVDCLTEAAQRAGVKVYTGAPVTSVVARSAAPADPAFEIRLKSGKLLKSQRLLLATGSHPLGHRLAKSFGYQIQPPVPSLFTFNIDDPRLQDLAGVSVPAAHLKLLVEGHKRLEQVGPLLITHWGLSGPAVLKLSAWGARILHQQKYQAQLQINWLPQFNQEKLRQTLLAVKSQLPQKSIAAACPVPLPRRLWERLVHACGISAGKRWAELSHKLLHRMIQELVQGQYTVQGKGIFKEEFVTCGGVSLKQVNFKTMESRLCPGLYFAGEILDIDGVTGGFNFQSAWTTAWLAGQGMGQEIGQAAGKSLG